MQKAERSSRAIWLALITMFAVVAALVAGGLMWIAGGGAVVAICGGGATFVSAVTLGLAGYRFLVCQ